MVSLPRRLRVLAFVLCVPFFLLAVPAYAGAFGLGGATPSSPTLVSAAQVRERAISAFDGTVARRLDAVRGGQADDTQPPAERYRAAAERIRATFVRELDDKLEQLEGDGLLEASETTDAIGELRQELLRDLGQAFIAAREGKPPPPLRRDHDDTWGYAHELVHYTFLVRNAPWDWLRLVLYVFGGLVLAWLTGQSLGTLSDALRARGWSTAALLATSLRGPLYVITAVGGIYLGLKHLWIPGVAQPVLQKGLWLFVVAALFWLLWGAARGMAAAGAKLFSKTYRKAVDHHIELLVLRILRVLILVGFVVIVVDVVFTSSLAGLLTGLGIIGVALSFVMRGSVENLAAAFTLFGDKPVRVGDVLIFKDEWAKVEDIGFRATRIRTFDGHLIHVPNSELIDAAIRNISARPYIRRRFRLGLTYDTPADKVREAIDIIKDILHDHEGQPDDQPPHVMFEAYGDYDLRLLVQYCVQPPDYWQVLEFDSRINLQILERFNAAGIEFAFPTRTNVIKTDPDDPPALFPRDGEREGQGEATGDDPDRDRRQGGRSRAAAGSAPGEYREGDAGDR